MTLYNAVFGVSEGSGGLRRQERVNTRSGSEFRYDREITPKHQRAIDKQSERDPQGKKRVAAIRRLLWLKAKAEKITPARLSDDGEPTSRGMSKGKPVNAGRMWRDHDDPQAPSSETRPSEVVFRRRVQSPNRGSNT